MEHTTTSPDSQGKTTEKGKVMDYTVHMQEKSLRYNNYKNNMFNLKQIKHAR